MAHFIAVHGKSMLQYVEDVAQYVEIVAEQMSVLEAMEPLLPIDTRFHWLRDVLALTNVAITGSGGVADPGDATAKREEDLDLAVLDNFVMADEAGNPIMPEEPSPQSIEPGPKEPEPQPEPLAPKQAQPVLVVESVSVAASTSVPGPVPVQQTVKQPTQPAPAPPQQARVPVLTVKSVEPTPPASEQLTPTKSPAIVPI
jgi:hypothetical protein